MPSATDLPPSQLYIVLGAIATACAIIATTIPDNSRGRVLRLSAAILLAVATTVSAVPVVWPVAMISFPSLPKIPPEWYCRLHLTSLGLLYFLAMGTFIVKGFGGGGLRNEIPRSAHRERKRLIREKKRVINREIKRLKRLKRLQN